MSSRKPKAPGVVTFAAVLFTIAGFFHGIEGLGAIFKKEYFNGASLLYSNLQVWGWASLILGILQISAAYMIIGRATAGRTLGIVVASISAIATFFSIEAHPLGGAEEQCQLVVGGAFGDGPLDELDLLAGVGLAGGWELDEVVAVVALNAHAVLLRW